MGFEMQNRITEAKVVEAIAIRENDAAVEGSILEQIGNSKVLHIDDSAIPFVANILTPQGALDRMLKNFLRGVTRPSVRWKTIARMARQGSRIKEYAEKRALKEPS